MKSTAWYSLVYVNITGYDNKLHANHQISNASQTKTDKTANKGAVKQKDMNKKCTTKAHLEFKTALQ